MDGVQGYAVPFLCQDERPALTSTPHAVMFRLQSIERKLDRDPALAEKYCSKMDQLIDERLVLKVEEGDELWLDPGTNFVGGRNEIADALSKMEPQVAKQLADKVPQSSSSHQVPLPSVGRGSGR